MAPPLTRTWFDTLIDDDGSGTVGTIWNKAQIDGLLDTVDASLAALVTNPHTGNVTINGHLSVNNEVRAIAPAGLRLGPSTADGADNRWCVIEGGGAPGATRGAAVEVHGNETGMPGRVNINLGNVAGAALAVNNGAGSQLLHVNGATGYLSLLGGIRMTLGEINQATADGADTGYIQLTGGGSYETTRGARFVIFGNEYAGSGGSAILDIGAKAGAVFVVNTAIGASLKIDQAAGHVSFCNDLVLIYPQYGDMRTKHIYPQTHNTYSLGHPTLYWSAVYATTLVAGTISTPANEMRITGHTYPNTDAVWYLGHPTLRWAEMNTIRANIANLASCGEVIANVAIASGWATLDLSACNNFAIDANQNFNVQFINPKPNGTITSFTLMVRHNPGPFTVYWPAGVRWPNSNAASNVGEPPGSGNTRGDWFTFISYDGGAIWFGSVVKNFVWW